MKHFLKSSKLKTLAKKFSRNEGGIAAIEFAAIVPFLLVLVIGISEFTDAYSARKKSNNANNVVGDLFAQFGTVSAKDGKGIFDIAAETLEPFPGAGDFSAKVFMVTYDSDGDQNVAWSWTRGGSCKANDKAGLPTLPAEIATPNSSWVVVSSELKYKPILTAIFIKDTGISFKEQSFYRPRVASQISAC